MAALEMETLADLQERLIRRAWRTSVCELLRTDPHTAIAQQTACSCREMWNPRAQEDERTLHLVVPRNRRVCCGALNRLPASYRDLC